MINHATVAEWLNAYVEAWKSYDPQAIGNLFAADATYSYNPFDDEAVRGRDAIVAHWLEYRDAPGTYDAHYEPIAVDGNIAVANGRTHYVEVDDKMPAPPRRAGGAIGEKLPGLLLVDLWQQMERRHKP